MLYRYGQARTSPTPPLTHLRFDGILLCEAVSRSAIFTPKRKGLWPVKIAIEAIKPHSRGTRPRRERIEVWVSIDEKKELAERADQAGLSNAAFLRAVGLNLPIGSRADLEAVRQLAKVNGDLGRVAGLLKLWLAEKRGQGARPIDVEAMMMDFRAIQEDMRALMGRISK